MSNLSKIAKNIRELAKIVSDETEEETANGLEPMNMMELRQMKIDPQDIAALNLYHKVINRMMNFPELGKLDFFVDYILSPKQIEDETGKKVPIGMTSPNMLARLIDRTEPKKVNPNMFFIKLRKVLTRKKNLVATKFLKEILDYAVDNTPNSLRTILKNKQVRIKFT